ncbi:uncharacterized protein LOC113003520 [Solenopsis invicta]|uniref:uncharacterized protein LOC113003520 n=1 Tax=Solenopsis invicta TaxID=13686 RepID=UPI00193D6A29|nr:uncharacterized protein LOC113003520 [Solenopsis invicta]
MTNTCVVCNKQSIPFDTSRSFHKFPVNVEMKKKWMEAIGVTTVCKTASICSDHFHEDSFHQTDGYTTLRRLVSTAVPFNRNGQLSSPINNVPTQILDDITNHPDTAISVENTFSTNTNTSGFETHNHLSPRNGIKRKSSVVNIHPTKFRFMVGSQSESFSRKHFASDEAWERFVRVMAAEKSKKSAIHMKLTRKEKINTNIRELIKTVKEKQFSKAAECLQVNL